MGHASETASGRTIGLTGATLIGVGAIVGGGILALAGTALSVAGPSAIIAFLLCGVIAGVTAMSFALMATSFPESGGTYTFAKKVLSVEAAFGVGWMAWFASLVAGMLYALGFGAFFVPMVVELFRIAGREAPAFLASRWAVSGCAAAAVLVYTGVHLRKTGGGGAGATVGKIVLFAVIILAGIWAMARQDPAVASERMTPFFTGGVIGVVQAMGFVFIALQGFDLIAAVAGEVKEPQRNLPRAMLLSLAIALVVYIPLLVVVICVGVGPGENIVELSRSNPDTLVALAVKRFMGSAGYWLIMVAAVLAMLSALAANLYAASRIALAMARDRTLPLYLGARRQSGIPYRAVQVSALGMLVLILVVPDVASAGAMASLIFLLTFALVHGTAILSERRGGTGQAGVFRMPFFPWLPFAGMGACLALAVFQGFVVPTAGFLVLGWVTGGSLLFAFLFARQARLIDASSQARDPMLARLRGLNPLVLVPIANPRNAAALTELASALKAPGVGRVLLLSVVSPPAAWDPETPPQRLKDAQDVLGEALSRSFSRGYTPEALTTIAGDPWDEIARVARLYRCQSMVLGFSRLTDEMVEDKLETLVNRLACDTVTLRAPEGWQVGDVKKVLVPVGGRRGGHDELRARILGSLSHFEHAEVTFLQLLPENASVTEVRDAEKYLRAYASVELDGAQTNVVRTANVEEELIRQTAEADLVVLGLQRQGKKKAFGKISRTIAAQTETAMVMISRGRDKNR